MQRESLVNRRKEKKWSQKDVIEELLNYGFSISVSYYGMIEQGVRTPKLELAYAISRIFECRMEELFFDLKPNKKLAKSELGQNSA